VEAITFSWDFTTTPVAAAGFAALSKITIDESVLSGTNLTAVLKALWGDAVTESYLPLPDALFALLA
jgi:hypothetical protein